MRLLLHELGVSTDEGRYIVGQAEYERQSSKHGGGREMAVLAKNIARVLVMMGLGPMPGTAMKVEEEAQCSLTENKDLHPAGHDNATLWMLLVLMLIMIAWSVFLWRLVKWLRQMWDGHENLCLQVAELDAYAGGIRTDCDRLRQNMTELEQNQEMVPDGTDAIHCAVVEMGGYVRMSELSADQRRHMYVQERGHMVAANAMGQQRYLQVIRQQNHGFAVGQDTDVRMEEGEHNGESENDSDADDPTIAAEGEGPWTPLINMFRDEISNALRVENFRDVSELQRIVLI